MKPPTWWTFSKFHQVLWDSAPHKRFDHTIRLTSFFKSWPFDSPSWRSRFQPWKGHKNGLKRGHFEEPGTYMYMYTCYYSFGWTSVPSRCLNLPSTLAFFVFFLFGCVVSSIFTSTNTYTYVIIVLFLRSNMSLSSSETPFNHLPTQQFFVSSMIDTIRCVWQNKISLKCHVKETYPNISKLQDLKSESIWMFPKIVVPPNHPFQYVFPIETIHFGVPLFSETPIWESFSRPPHFDKKSISRHPNSIRWTMGMKNCWGESWKLLIWNGLKMAMEWSTNVGVVGDVVVLVVPNRVYIIYIYKYVCVHIIIWEYTWIHNQTHNMCTVHSLGNAWRIRGSVNCNFALNQYPSLVQFWHRKVNK